MLEETNEEALPSGACARLCAGRFLRDDPAPVPNEQPGLRVPPIVDDLWSGRPGTHGFEKLGHLRSNRYTRHPTRIVAYPSHVSVVARSAFQESLNLSDRQAVAGHVHLIHGHGSLVVLAEGDAVLLEVGDGRVVVR